MAEDRNDTVARCWDQLREVCDPEVGLNIVDMGLVYDLRLDSTTARVEMTLTSPACPSGPEIIGEIRRRLSTLNGIAEVDVNVVWSPPWSPDRMTEEARDQLGIF